MSIGSLYPSAAGGSSSTLSPLSAPVAAVVTPVAVTSSPAPVEAAAPIVQPPLGDEPSAELDADDTPWWERDDQSAVDNAEAEAAEAPAPAVVQPIIDDRPKIAAALDNARMTEPAATGVSDYANFARTPEGVIPDVAEQQQALQAMLKVGLGVTQASAVWNVAMQAIRSPVTTNEAGAMQSLVESYGDRADAKLAAAKSYIDDVAKTYPGIRDFLNKTGLGNDPAMLRFAIQAAERRNSSR